MPIKPNADRGDAIQNFLTRMGYNDLQELVDAATYEGQGSKAFRHLQAVQAMYREDSLLANQPCSTGRTH